MCFLHNKRGDTTPSDGSFPLAPVRFPCPAQKSRIPINSTSSALSSCSLPWSPVDSSGSQGKNDGCSGQSFRRRGRTAARKIRGQTIMFLTHTQRTAAFALRPMESKSRGMARAALHCGVNPVGAAEACEGVPRGNKKG